MKISAYLLVPMLTAVAACGGSSAPDASRAGDSAPSESLPLPTNHEIAALVYDNLYTVPDGFFVDERADTERSYSLHHVLDESGSYELCTDDYAVALAWEDADNASRSVQGYYVESYENGRYFEFVRELAYDNDIGNVADITSPGFARVFKCSHTNRDGVDRNLLTGYAGTLNAQPLDGEALRLFAEYLWQFTFFPNSRSKVIASVASVDDSQLQRTLQLAFATRQAGDDCDLVEVTEWRFTADPGSGEVHRRFDVVRSFEARVDESGPVLCE